MINVRIGPAASGMTRLSRHDNAEDLPYYGGVRLAHWEEFQGRGATSRLVYVRYEDIPALIGVLAKALVTKQKRDSKKAAA